jgi:hypothetical protein
VRDSKITIRQCGKKLSPNLANIFRQFGLHSANNVDSLNFEARIKLKQEELSLTNPTFISEIWSSQWISLSVVYIHDLKSHNTKNADNQK